MEVTDELSGTLTTLVLRETNSVERQPLWCSEILRKESRDPSGGCSFFRSHCDALCTLQYVVVAERVHTAGVPR